MMTPATDQHSAPNPRKSTLGRAGMFVSFVAPAVLAALVLLRPG
jgi:hypothetical protein